MEKNGQKGNKWSRFQEVMGALSNVWFTDRDGAVKTVMDLLAGSLPAGRLGLWLLNEERSMMVCRNLIVKSKNASPHTGAGIKTERYPGYLADLEKGPVTLAGGISAPALLDAPVMVGGKIAGILSVGPSCRGHGSKGLRKGFTNVHPQERCPFPYRGGRVCPGFTPDFPGSGRQDRRAHLQEFKPVPGNQSGSTYWSIPRLCDCHLPGTIPHGGPCGSG